MKLEIENGVLKKLDVVYFEDFDLDIVIPYGVKKIGYQAFQRYGCRVKSITIPDTVTEIDDDAFADCDLITKYNYPRQCDLNRKLCI